MDGKIAAKQATANGLLRKKPVWMLINSVMSMMPYLLE